MYMPRKLYILAALYSAVLCKCSEGVQHTSRAAQILGGVMETFRDFSSALQFQYDVRPFGCVIIKRADGKGGPPIAAISGAATEDQCAGFQYIPDPSLSYKGNPGYRYLELSTNKLMSHAAGSDWIYFDKPANDTSSETLFYPIFKAKTRYLSTMLSANAGKEVYAEYDSGDMNVKGAGFKVFIH